jgi:hypothetical protein
MASESKQNIKQYLEGVEYPAETFDLVTTVESNGAPAEVIDRLDQLPNNAEFSNPEEVIEQLENIEKSGIPTPEHEVE